MARRLQGGSTVFTEQQQLCVGDPEQAPGKKEGSCVSGVHAGLGETMPGRHPSRDNPLLPPWDQG